jgi:hypothetical protein
MEILYSRSGGVGSSHHIRGTHIRSCKGEKYRSKWVYSGLLRSLLEFSDIDFTTKVNESIKCKWFLNGVMRGHIALCLRKEMD